MSFFRTTMGIIKFKDHEYYIMVSLFIDLYYLVWSVVLWSYSCSYHGTLAHHWAVFTHAYLAVLTRCLPQCLPDSAYPMLTRNAYPSAYQVTRQCLPAMLTWQWLPGNAHPSAYPAMLTPSAYLAVLTRRSAYSSAYLAMLTPVLTRQCLPAMLTWQWLPGNAYPSAYPAMLTPRAYLAVLTRRSAYSSAYLAVLTRQCLPQC